MNRTDRQIDQELENLKALFEIAPEPAAAAEQAPTITERFEAIEAQGFRYISNGRGWFTGIWINDALGCTLNWCGGSYPSIAEAVSGAERFIDALARIERS